jgi:hypothetical protein
MHFDQVSIHPHVVGAPPRDCIVPLTFPSLEAPQEIQVAQLPSTNHTIQEGNPISTPSDIANVPAAHLGSPFEKSTITMKAFLLQKTNEKLFGTAAPSTDLKLETFARYASQTVGIPVQYRVEEMTNSDKIVFQLGRFSVERNRAKK